MCSHPTGLSSKHFLESVDKFNTYDKNNYLESYAEAYVHKFF